MMGEKGDGGLGGRESGGVPVIGYAPVVEVGGWWDRWGVAGFLAGGFVLGVVGFGVEGNGGSWSKELGLGVRWGLVMMMVVIGWVVRERPYFKSVALALGFGWGGDVVGGVLSRLETGGWSNVGEDRLWIFVVIRSIAILWSSMALGLLSVAGMAAKNRLGRRGRSRGNVW